MRIAILADTHLPRGRRRLAGEVLRRVREADLVLHAGDFTAASVLAELEHMAPVAAVHGNMDDLELRERLPERRIVEVAAVRVGMIHDAGPAAGRHERLVPAFPGCHAIVYGHTHVPEISVHGTVLILNPGSPTERRRAPSHTMAMLEIAGRRMAPELVELDP